MTTEVVALAGGILFLLVAIVGGGFAIREISLPTVPSWARVASAVFGLLLLVPFLLATFRGERTSPDRGLENPPARQDGGGSGIEVDTEPATSADGIQLTELAASVRNDPARVGDTVEVSYALTNVGTEPVRLEYTFVGARDAEDGNKDSEDENESRTLQLGETVQARGRIFLDTAGTWVLWPCYALSGGRYCPDEWRAFTVVVR